MKDAQVRAYLALGICTAFFVLVMIIMIGVVDIRDPTVAKIAGTMVGYITALMNPIIMRYFREPVGPPPDTM